MSLDGRVLIVEDDPAQREMLVGFLQDLGVETEEAEDGHQALEEHEVIECHRMPLAKAVELVLSGDIVDGKTVSLLLMAAVAPALWGG